MKYVDQFLKILAETDYNALVRKEGFLFCMINIFLPFMMTGLLSLMFPFLKINFLISVVFVFLMIAANTYRIKRTQKLKKTYCVFVFLNPLSFIFAGGPSFASTFLFWPIVIQHYYADIRGYETVIPLY